MTNQTIIFISLFLIVSSYSCKEEAQNIEPSLGQPTVNILSPLDNSVISDSTLVEIEATDDKGVVKVEVYIDSQLDTNHILYVKPYRYIWYVRYLQDSSFHTIYAKAYDGDGNIATSKVLNILVRVTPKGVVILSPQNNSIVIDSTEVEVQALYDREIEKIEVYLDGHWNHTLFFKPYRYILNVRTLQDSSQHSLYAKAYYLDGEVVTSDIVNFLVRITASTILPPSNLKALSRDGAVTLYWTASPMANWGIFAGYRIMTRPVGQTGILVDSVQVSKTAINHTVENLTNGQNYIFSIRSVQTNGDVSEELTIQWGPTRRFLTAARVYEFESTNPNGLQFSTASVFTFSSASPDNRALIDLWIDGRGNNTPLLKSPHDQTISIGWRTTQFIETAVSDMNIQVDVPPISSFRSTPGLTIIANRVYFARTQDGNYVRFQVSAVQGSYPNRYIDVHIAYNSGTGSWVMNVPSPGDINRIYNLVFK